MWWPFKKRELEKEIVCGYCGAKQGHYNFWKMIARGCKECGRGPERKNV